MDSLGTILRRRDLYAAAGLIFLIKLILLLFSTPLYDLDTNSFIRGGLTWDIYHNPFMNLFIAGFGKIWPNAWFIVAVQCLGYSLCGAFLLEVWFRNKPSPPTEAVSTGQTGQGRSWLRRNTPWYWVALTIIALEPLTTFYNFSLLAESFFTGFTFLSIAAAILWLRRPSLSHAVFFGAAIGLTFLCKLSAMVHLPLFGVFLLANPVRKGEHSAFIRFLKGPVKHGISALIPFILCYVFVYVGQKTINEGDLYTVEGRVRWDFSSAYYQSDEVEGPEFKRFVEPYILDQGQLVAHRELRRELSYLGYKDCVADYEARGAIHNRGVNACDSIFGAVAAQIMDRYFWESEVQFIKDNFRFIHELSYIDYRFTQGLHYYHPESEWHYLDSLMFTHYQLDLSQNSEKVPSIFTSLSFGNIYMPILWWLCWVTIGTALILWFRNKKRKDLLLLALFLAIPMIFHLVYISYRPRFLAPYLVLELLLFLQVSMCFFRGKTSGST